VCLLRSCDARLASDGRSLRWIERTATGEKVYETEPGTSVLKRMGFGMMSILPIEWLL